MLVSVLGGKVYRVSIYLLGLTGAIALFVPKQSLRFSMSTSYENSEINLLHALWIEFQQKEDEQKFRSRCCHLQKAQRMLVYSGYIWEANQVTATHAVGSRDRAVLP